MRISKKVLGLKPSATLAVLSRVRQLKIKGAPVISLTVGEPDWPTVSVATEAGIEAIRAGMTKYTPSAGIPELRKAIAKEALLQTGIPYLEAGVCVGAGAKLLLFSALQLLCDPGDEVLFFSPYWVSYPEIIKLVDGIPKAVEMPEESGFRLDLDRLSSAINERTKVLLLCSPNNPTGVTLSREELEGLAELVRQNQGLTVISDDIYNRLVFSSERSAPHLLQVARDLKDRVICLNGVSKAYSMTGWRVGWVSGPEAFILSLSNHLSQISTCAFGVSQAAAIAALTDGEDELLQRLAELKKKYDWFVPALNSIRGFQAQTPDGAFFLWVRVNDFFGKRGISDSKSLAFELLENQFVATVPGSEFGVEGYLRMSISVSDEDLREALRRFEVLSKSIFPT
jgi:aspartate aminotransferase